MKPVQAKGSFAADDTLRLTVLVTDILKIDSESRDESAEEFRRIFDLPIRKIASAWQQSLPHYQLDYLVNEAFSFLTTGLCQTAQGEPTIRKAPLQVWLEKPVKKNAAHFFTVCVYNYFRDLWRQRRTAGITNFVSLEGSGLESRSDPNWQTQITDDEERMIVREAMLHLPPRDRFILEQIALEGKTHREVAEMTGTSESHVRLAFGHARQRLQRKLSHLSKRPS